MAATTLRKSDDGEHYVLRCPPEYEIRVVEYARSYGGLVDLGDLPCRIKVIGADPTLPSALPAHLELDLMGATEYDFLPDATHYLQLEKPEECVRCPARVSGPKPVLTKPAILVWRSPRLLSCRTVAWASGHEDRYPGRRVALRRFPRH